MPYLFSTEKTKYLAMLWKLPASNTQISFKVALTDPTKEKVFPECVILDSGAAVQNEQVNQDRIRKDENFTKLNTL